LIGESESAFVRSLNHLFESNRAWAESIRKADPQFFEKLSRQQAPSYLWIGCSDSRVPATQIVDLLRGEMFVHRNLANVVEESDTNCLSVLQFAVEVLKIKHVIVCGHYGCAGILAAQRREQLGIADQWLRHVRRVGQKDASILESIKDEAERANRFCEVNVIEQVAHVWETSICQAAWHGRQELAVHGWICGIQNGILHDLGVTVSNSTEIQCSYDSAIRSIQIVRTSRFGRTVV
jgi:carbonic anhydrase